MATDESHDEALPKTAHADGRRWWILPVYHGNEAETDLIAVGDVDGDAGLSADLRAMGKFAFA